MSATNKTPNIELPLFLGTDIPSWLTDWNGAMTKIDTAISSQTTADEALSVAQGAQTTANAANALATQANQKATDNATLLTSVNTRVDTLSQTVGEQATEITANTNSTANNTTVLNNMLSSVKDADPTQTTLPLWSGAITTKANTNSDKLVGMLTSVKAQTSSVADLPSWSGKVEERLNTIDDTAIGQVKTCNLTIGNVNKTYEGYTNLTGYESGIVRGWFHENDTEIHFSTPIVGLTSTALTNGVKYMVTDWYNMTASYSSGGRGYVKQWVPSVLVPLQVTGYAMVEKVVGNTKTAFTCPVEMQANENGIFFTCELSTMPNVGNPTLCSKYYDTESSATYNLVGIGYDVTLSHAIKLHETVVNG